MDTEGIETSGKIGRDWERWQEKLKPTNWEFPLVAMTRICIRTAEKSNLIN